MDTVSRKKIIFRMSNWYVKILLRFISHYIFISCGQSGLLRLTVLIIKYFHIYLCLLKHVTPLFKKTQQNISIVCL